jgi:hypothetical protein
MGFHRGVHFCGHHDNCGCPAGKICAYLPHQPDLGHRKLQPRVHSFPQTGFGLGAKAAAGVR